MTRPKYSTGWRVEARHFDGKEEKTIRGIITGLRWSAVAEGFRYWVQNNADEKYLDESEIVKRLN